MTDASAIHDSPVCKKHVKPRRKQLDSICSNAGMRQVNSFPTHSFSHDHTSLDVVQNEVQDEKILINYVNSSKHCQCANVCRRQGTTASDALCNESTMQPNARRNVVK